MDKKPHLLYMKINHFNDNYMSDSLEKRVIFSYQGIKHIQDKELNIARILASYYNVNILFLPIRNIKGVKNPDLLIGSYFVEIKNVTGGLKAVGKNFRNATRQADNIVLSIQNESYSIHEIRNKIYGEIQLLIKDGKWDERKPKFLIIIFKDKLYSWYLSKGSNKNTM